MKMCKLNLQFEPCFFLLEIIPLLSANRPLPLFGKQCILSESFTHVFIPAGMHAHTCNHIRYFIMHEELYIPSVFCLSISLIVYPIMIGGRLQTSIYSAHLSFMWFPASLHAAQQNTFDYSWDSGVSTEIKYGVCLERV